SRRKHPGRRLSDLTRRCQAEPCLATAKATPRWIWSDPRPAALGVDECCWRVCSDGKRAAVSRGRVCLACYGGWMVILTVGYYAIPGWHVVLWSAIGLSSAAAVVVGRVIRRPSRGGPWLLLAVALVTFSAGDTTYNV